MRKLQREAQHPFPETPPYRDATRRELIYYHPYEMSRRFGWVLLLRGVQHLLQAPSYLLADRAN
jgi:hypothetical protein